MGRDLLKALKEMLSLNWGGWHSGPQPFHLLASIAHDWGLGIDGGGIERGAGLLEGCYSEELWSTYGLMCYRKDVL